MKHQCKIHWETPVKMREGLFVLVFAVFCSGCEPSPILIVRSFCVFYLHFFVIMFCLQVNVPQRSITHVRKCTWTLLPHPTPTPPQTHPNPMRDVANPQRSIICLPTCQWTYHSVASHIYGNVLERYCPTPPQPHPKPTPTPCVT